MKALKFEKEINEVIEAMHCYCDYVKASDNKVVGYYHDEYGSSVMIDISNKEIIVDSYSEYMEDMILWEIGVVTY